MKFDCQWILCEQLDRHFCVLNIIRYYSREIVGQLVQISIAGYPVVHLLDDLKGGWGLSISLRQSQLVQQEGYVFLDPISCAKPGFVQAGKPNQNALEESLKRKSRNGFLIHHGLENLQERDGNRSIAKELRQRISALIGLFIH